MAGTVSTRWYFSDWLSDLGVRTSSLAARGLWIDLLAIAGGNKGRDYGFVVIAGKSPSIERIAKLINSSPEEVAKLLAELEENGVFSRDKRKIIYSRRMVRSQKNRTNGREGGNPKLLEKNENQNPVIHSLEIPIPEPLPEPGRKDSPLPPSGGSSARLEPPKEKSKRNPGAPLPADWQPADRSVALGHRHGLADFEIQDEADRMREWAEAESHRKVTLKANWDATFGGWLRRRADKKKGLTNGHHRQSSPAGRAKTFASNAHQLFREIQEDRFEKPAADVRSDGRQEPPILDLLPTK